MNLDTEATQQDYSLSQEAYGKAMNFIGQNLLTSLVETMQNLPPPLRNNEIALQGLAAFLSNVIHKQFPEDPESRHQLLGRLTRLISTHLDSIEQLSQESGHVN